MSSLSSIRSGTSYLQNQIVNSLLNISVRDDSKIKQSVNALSEIDICCNTIEPSPCTVCLQQFLEQSEISDRSKADPLKAKECSVWCNCNLSDSKLKSSLKILMDVDESADPEKIANDVINSFQKQFKTVVSLNNQKQIQGAINNIISNIRTTLKEQETQQATQRVGAIQSVKMNTSGGDTKNLDLNSSISALFKIVQSSDATANLNTFVQAQMEQIKKEVDKTVKQDFSTLWDTVKWYVIGFAIFIGLLLILLIFLLIKKAAS
jgi:CHASE3 domain sensor protein